MRATSIALLASFALAVAGHAAVFPPHEPLHVTIAGDEVSLDVLSAADLSRSGERAGEIANDVWFDADGEIPKLSAAPPWAMTFLALLLVSSGYFFLGARPRDPESVSGP